MEYSTSRIHLPKLSAAPSLRISFSSQYKNHGPIVTPTRKPRAPSRKKRTHLKPKNVRGGEDAVPSSLRSSGLVAADISESTTLTVMHDLDTFPLSRAPLQFEASCDIDGLDQLAGTGTSHQLDTSHSTPRQLYVPRNSDLDGHPPSTTLSIPQSREARLIDIAKALPEDYQLFFESVISGSLLFYQLSKKTFVSKGWNIQKSEGSVSSINLFVLMSLNTLLDSLVSYTCHYGGGHKDCRVPVSRFQENVFVLPFKVHT